MGLILAAGAAVLVSLGVALVGRILPGWWGRVAAGGAVWLGLAAGLLVAWLTSAATNLVVILLATALVAALVGTGLQLAGAHWVWCVLAQLVVLGAAMGLEYRRGDLFAVTAAVGAGVGVIVLQALVFATCGAQNSGAGRTPPILALLGAAYLLLIAWRLPNPGLATLVLVVAAAVAPLAVLPGLVGPTERALGPVLAAAAWASGSYAWLANASPAMVLAPVVVVGLDVAWTLTRRVVTIDGRARLASTRSWWRGLGAWGEPSDDLVVQRAAGAGSGRAASGWLLGATAAVLVLSLAQWMLEVRWLPALLGLVLLALGWLLLQLARVRLPRAEVIAWLAGLTAVAGVLAVAEHVTDGRRLATLLPVLVVLAVWAAAAPRLYSRPSNATG